MHGNNCHLCFSKISENKMLYTDIGLGRYV